MFNGGHGGAQAFQVDGFGARNRVAGALKRLFMFFTLCLVVHKGAA